MSQPNNSAITMGVHHVGLTVPDVAQSADFFISVLGFKQVGARPDYPAIFVSDGTVMLTLWQAENPLTARSFNRKTNIGLHHLALKLGQRDLDALHAKLEQVEGVEIEFAPEALGTAGARHMMCLIPGGLRIEFTAPPE